MYEFRLGGSRKITGVHDTTGGPGKESELGVETEQWTTISRAIASAQKAN